MDRLAAPFPGSFASRLVDQHSSHEPRRYGEKVRAILYDERLNSEQGLLSRINFPDSRWARSAQVKISGKEFRMFRVTTSAFLICLSAIAQQRPPDPTRDPHTPGYVTAKELPDGEIPTPKQNGNFIIGPTHNPAPEMAAREGVPKGDVFEFTMESKDSKI